MHEIHSVSKPPPSCEYILKRGKHTGICHLCLPRLRRSRGRTLWPHFLDVGVFLDNAHVPVWMPQYILPRYCRILHAIRDTVCIRGSMPLHPRQGMPQRCSCLTVRQNHRPRVTTPFADPQMKIADPSTTFGSLTSTFLLILSGLEKQRTLDLLPTTGLAS